MATTDNYKLAQLELTSSANFPALLNNTFKTIDKGLTLEVGSSTGTGNDYILNLGSITLSSANKGISFKFWADKDSNGAVTINGTYHLVKASGNPVKNLKRNAPYTITYDGGTNFFLASGGVDDVNFSASDLLSGKTANNSDGEKVTGTMPNIGQQTATINAGGKVTISKGYHDGTGYVQSNSMSTQLSNLGVTLTSASQLVKGVKAVNKNGNLITGTATIASLGGLIVQQGSGNYTPTYGLNYNGNAVETMTLTVPLNLSFTAKILIITYEIDDYVGNKLVTDVLNSYTNTWTKGVTNYSYGSTSSSETYNHTSTTRSISSMPKDSISITATNMNYANVWSFPYNGSVYHPNESDGFTPLPTNISWTAIG